jgi:hypothetical protein
VTLSEMWYLWQSLYASNIKCILHDDI